MYLLTIRVHACSLCLLDNSSSHAPSSCADGLLHVRLLLQIPIGPIGAHLTLKHEMWNVSLLVCATRFLLQLGCYECSVPNPVFLLHSVCPRPCIEDLCNMHSAMQQSALMLTAIFQHSCCCMHACVVVQVATEVVLGGHLETWIVHSRKDKEVRSCQCNRTISIHTRLDSCSLPTMACSVSDTDA
jgi:hypothetical protein